MFGRLNDDGGWVLMPFWLMNMGFAAGGIVAPGLSDGDEVQVLIAGGIQCTVLRDSGTLVRVVIASAKQISVLHTGGTPIKVTI